MNESLKRSRILVIDDSDANLFLLEAILDDIGYQDVVTLNDPREAVATYQAYDPDLILLDLHMPRVSGLDVMAQIRERQGPTYLPILMLTADMSAEAKVRALSTGANDFVSKPFDRTEVELRIRNLLQTRTLYQQLDNQKNVLEEKIVERTRQLEATKLEILERLAMATEFRDDQTGQHTQRVGRTSALVATALGLSEKEVKAIRTAAPLHDIGKIGIPDAILLKPGPLASGEFELMKRHTSIGAKLVSNSTSSTLQLAEQIAATHHERWDGSGYGTGLAAEQIPMAGRILAIADVFDALTHPRPYKDAWSEDIALEEVRRLRGTQFDPNVVDAFLAVQGQIDLVNPDDVPQPLLLPDFRAEGVDHLHETSR